MKFLIFCTFFTIGSCVSIEQNDFNSRIIGGFEVQPGDLPYMVSLTVDHPDNLTFCGGSLISTDLVLTAATCFKGRTNVRAKALVGASDLKDLRSVEIWSQEIFVHPEFDSSSLANDIAIVRLNNHFQLGPLIQTVTLPLRSDIGRSFNGFPSITGGWGVAEDNRNAPLPNQHLRAVRSSVMTNLACRLRFPLFVNEMSICTNADAEIGSPCRGDEGSPLVIDAPGQFLQVGVYSFQFSLGCDRGWPAVYMRTSRYLDWIADVTGLVLP